MLASETISIFKELVDDQSISDTLALSLLNTTKTVVEEERDWKFLFTKDTSLTFLTSEDYTDAKALPTYFSSEKRVKLVDSSNDEDDYLPIDYADLLQYKDGSARYAIDYLNQKMYFCGTVATNRTVHLFYQKYTADVAAVGDTLPWPRFNNLLPYRMAEIWLRGVDADSLTRLQWPAHRVAGDAVYSAMVRWDTKLQMKAMNNMAGFKTLGVSNQDNQIDRSL